MKPLDIIMVDDDMDSAEFLKGVMHRTGLGHTLQILRGYMPLMEYINNENPLPDLIILDVNMPVIGGIETLKILKSDARYKHIPIVICSGLNRPADVDHCYDAGAHYFFIKPFSVDDYLNCFKQLFSIDWHAPQPQPPRDQFILQQAARRS